MVAYSCLQSSRHFNESLSPHPVQSSFKVKRRYAQSFLHPVSRLLLPFPRGACATAPASRGLPFCCTLAYRFSKPLSVRVSQRTACNFFVTSFFATPCCPMLRLAAPSCSYLSTFIVFSTTSCFLISPGRTDVLSSPSVMHGRRTLFAFLQASPTYTLRVPLSITDVLSSRSVTHRRRPVFTFRQAPPTSFLSVLQRFIVRTR